MQASQRAAESSLDLDADAALAEAVRVHQAGQLEEAERRYRNILDHYPRQFDCLHLSGVVHYQREEYDEAIRKIDNALEVNPNAAVAHNSRGAALKELKRYDAALVSYERAIELKPGYADAINNRAVVLHALKRFVEAQAACEQAIALKPDFAEAFYNCGNAFGALKRFNEALANYDRAIALKPDYAEAFKCRGAMLAELKRFPEALASYDRAVALKPDLRYLRGERLHLKMNLCDWTDFDGDCSRIGSAIASRVASATPFQLLATPLGPDDQLRCARLLVAEEFPASPRQLWCGERYDHDRIRIAYLSADFREHPVSYLIAGLFERHDRRKFEIFGISFGADDAGETRARLKRGVDHFIDVDRHSDLQAAILLRELEIDIAIDLMGLTGNTRLGIFAQRPSPIQVSYLGYAGTTGATYIDYIIADSFLIPDDQQHHFQEKVVQLPDSFQANDAGRPIARHVPSRLEAGLPERSFVFCCFNNMAKITPDVFAVWMRLLREVEGSVLWLAAGESFAIGNLVREAISRGVSPDRLIFAPKVMRQEDHLSRHRLADLFLDTRYFNAHSTASDALWAGLPVLTCSGATYASRVAGSLLNAVGLPELVTFSLTDYEALALTLARDPALLGSIRRRLAGNRDSCPLFDTGRFARDLEAAYTTMWQRHRRGDQPEGFVVAPIDLATG